METVETFDQIGNAIIEDMRQSVMTDEMKDQMADLTTQTIEGVIKEGALTPALEDSTINRKRAKNYSFPEAPVYATGAFAESGWEHENTEEGIDIFHDVFPVNPLFPSIASRLDSLPDILEDRLAQRFEEMNANRI